MQLHEKQYLDGMLQKQSPPIVISNITNYILTSIFLTILQHDCCKSYNADSAWSNKTIFLQG